MMKYRLATLLIGILFFNASYSQNEKKENFIKILNEWDTQEVAWFKTEGIGSIQGVASFKLKSGEVLKGEEFRIELMPSCSYTKERLNGIYNSINVGSIFLEDGVPKFTPDPEGYHDTIKAMCDNDGRFGFGNLPDGDYYVIAFMIRDKTGGGIMQRISLKEGESKNIEMTNF